MSGGRVSAWRAFWERGGIGRAVLLAVGYIVLFLAAARLLGTLFPGVIDPDDPLASPTGVLIGIGGPILLGGLLLMAFGWSVGWLRELFARQPIGGSWWMWIPPAVVVAINVARAVSVDYASYQVDVLVSVLVLGLFIGFAEEVLTRGYVVNLLRKGGHGEWVVMFVSSLVFAFLHSVNILEGQAITVVAMTIVYTFAFGAAMYLLLRASRNLIWPVLVHATTDPFGLLMAGGIDTHGSGVAEPVGPLAVLATAGNLIVIGMALIPLLFVRGRVEREAVGETRDLRAPAGA